MSWRRLVALLCPLVPWRLRRVLLVRLLGADLGPGAYVGRSVLFVDRLEVGERARIGDGNVIRNLERLSLGAQAAIGNLNWIAGNVADPRPAPGDSGIGRSVLVLDDGAALTHQHYLDCTDTVSIGRYSTVAGCRSKFFTHGIDVDANQQVSNGIELGPYTMVGAGVTLLMGSTVPPRCVVAAGAVVTPGLADELQLLAGVPARRIGGFSGEEAYFVREDPTVR